MGIWPIFPPSDIEFRSSSVEEIAAQTLKHRNTLVDYSSGTQILDNTYNKHLTSMLNLQLSNTNIVPIPSNTSSNQLIPDNSLYSISSIPSCGVANSGCLLSNSTAIHRVFGRINKEFLAMFRRKALLMWYTGEGMDEMEFTQAYDTVNELIDNYSGLE